MALTYEKMYSREQKRDARAFVFEYYVVPDWSCNLDEQQLQGWFEAAVRDDESITYHVAKDETGLIVGAHVTSSIHTEDSENVSHWRRVMTIVVAPGYGPLEMHWNLTREFMATVPEGESWVCFCERLVYEAVKDQPTMAGAIVRDQPENILGPTMCEVIGYHLDELPELIEVPYAN